MQSNNKSSADKIKCPQCGYLLPLTETLSKETEAKIRNEFEEKLQAEKEKMWEIAQKQAELSSPLKTGARKSNSFIIGGKVFIKK